MRCERCGLHRASCLCAEVRRLAVRTRVVVLMHHAEQRKSTNTGRLVALALDGAEIRVRGERDAPARPPLPPGRRLLLFPHPEARVLSPEDGRGDPAVLLVPDGNWNQARRISRRDADAAGAELVALPPGAPTRYELRRAPREGTVSTIEAVARALGLLEGEAIKRELMALFDVFVDRSLRAGGRGGRGRT